MKRYCFPVIALSILLCLSFASPAQAILVKNMTTDTVLFEDGFEENTSACSSAFGSDSEDYDPVDPNAYTGAYGINETHGYATQVCTGEADGMTAFEGDNYLRMNRVGSWYANYIDIPDQSTVGDWIHAECMIARVNLDSGSNKGGYINFCGDDNLLVNYVTVDQDGYFRNKDTTYMNLIMAEATWCKYEIDYIIGSSTYSLTLDGVLATINGSSDLPTYADVSGAAITRIRLGAASSSNQLSYFDHVSMVPEPTMVALLLVGLISLTCWRRCR